MAKDAKRAEEGGGAAEPAKESNRPENTKFKQQRLDAWQPILTPSWVIGTFIVVGIVFVPVGAYLLKLSKDLFEQIVVYDSSDVAAISKNVPAACQIDTLNAGYTELADGTNSRTYDSCTITFTFDKDIAEDDQVYVYYQIDNFYQNHRRYVKSVSESQLTDDITIDPVTDLSLASLETDCDPAKSFAASNEDGFGRIYYPCGLIALSVFNDGLELKEVKQTSGAVTTFAAGAFVSGNADVRLDKNGISWSSDLSYKYRNPTSTSCALDLNNAGGNLCPLRYFQYQYLWQTYNQFLCYPSKGGNDTNVPDLEKQPNQCISFTDFVKSEAESTYGASEYADFLAANPNLNPEFVGKCAKCGNNDVFVSAGGIKMPENFSSDVSPEGIRNEGFVVWMRTAGLPTFRKLIGKLTAPAGGFKSGDSVEFSIIPNFLVKEIDGSKAIVLGTTSPLGGKNDILGIAYITVGAICLVLALVFAIKLKVNPRKLGDPQSLPNKSK